MRAFVFVSCLLLAATVLAGCSGNPGKKTGQTGEQDFQELDLQATSTTGVLRGVVVDAAIRPVPNASIRVTGPTSGNTTTNADGLFGLESLQPGDYFIAVSKVGFQATQASGTVVAGVADPPIVKVVLTADPNTTPYVSTYVFEGFIECSESLVAAGHATCSAAGLPNDKFIVNYTLDKPPQWVQSEMSWESTQAVSPGLDVVYSVQGESVLLDNPVEDRGPSPLLLQANQTLAGTMGLGNGTDLLIRVFNEPVDGTRPSDPTDGDDCISRPALGGCATGFGVTIEQSFTIITNVFYGFAPDPAWRYADDGPMAAPPG